MSTSRRGVDGEGSGVWPRRRGLALACLALAVCGAGLLRAQSSLVDEINPVAQRRGGLHLYSASVFSTYYSIGVPVAGGSFFLPQGQGLSSDVASGAAGRLGWTHSGPLSHLAASYEGSYSGRVHYSELNAFNHALSFTGSRKLARRWTAAFSLAGSLTNLEQFLFEPTVLGRVSAVPASFDDLAAAMLAGKFTNEELASILTGAPVLESPGRTLFYGNRTLGSAAQASLSYSRSPRTSVHFGVGARRVEPWGDQSRLNLDRPTSLLQRTTSGEANLGIAYSLTPRTQLGADVSANRTFSTLQDAYTTSTTGFIGRTMGRRWFVQLRGGAGFITPIRQTFATPRGIQYIAGGSLTYKTYAHTLLFSYDRMISDSYGFGAASTTSGSAAWNWSRPGSAWRLFSSFGQQQLHGVGFSDINSWRAVAGIGRSLSRSVGVRFQYAYLTYSGTVNGQTYSLSPQAVQVSLVWAPPVAAQ